MYKYTWTGSLSHPPEGMPSPSFGKMHCRTVGTGGRALQLYYGKPPLLPRDSQHHPFDRAAVRLNKQTSELPRGRAGCTWEQGSCCACPAGLLHPAHEWCLVHPAVLCTKMPFHSFQSFTDENDSRHVWNILCSLTDNECLSLKITHLQIAHWWWFCISSKSIFSL